MSKSKILVIITILLFGLLGFRLVQLQVLQYKKYSLLARNNSSQVSVTRAPRGIIYDRNNQILATNRQSLSVIVYPAVLLEKDDKVSVAEKLAVILDMDFDHIMRIFKDMRPTTPLPLTIDNDISIEQSIKIFENSHGLPGIAVERQAIRFYPYGEVGSHFLGYVGEVNSRELGKTRNLRLHLGDIVGKEGLEKVYDEHLRGVNGERRVQVDRHGRILQARYVTQKTFKKAEKGDDLQLTIDIELQKVAEEAMGNMKGAVVVTNPQNGEIYALVSRPGYDPNIFTKPIPLKVYRRLSASKAFLNRALSSFTPGSIWKPLTALVALEHEVANRDESLKVSGSIMFGGFNFGDWTSKADIMNLPTALAWSRNTYFYQIARRLKPEWISETAKKFGMGKRTGIELLGESKGLVPSPEWKKSKLKQDWFPGNTLHFAIGQSFLLVTPLQAAKLMSSIAMNGVVPRLHLVENQKKTKPEREIKFADRSLQVVKEGLRMCVESGTGQVAKRKDVVIAGKTGSAEVQGYARSTHGWFVAYGPAGLKEDGTDEAPEIVVSVFGEGAGHGGTVCAPVAKKIFDAYFDRKNQAG